MGESQEFSHAKDTRQQAQQCWIHQVAGNPQRRRNFTETPMEQERWSDYEFQCKQETYAAMATLP